MRLNRCGPPRATGFIPAGASPAARRISRQGVAAVELALVLPLFALIVLGMFEMGRAIQVKEVLSNAARKGCRSGALTGANSAAVQNDVRAVLASQGLDTSKATISTLVNDAAADLIAAKPGDKISVQVTLPLSSAAWTGNFILTNQSLGSETLSMMRQ
jgi:Flp pilus assembly protein TadG